MEEKQNGPTIINCDNKSTIVMIKNSVHHTRTKHIEIKYHFITETETNMKIQLEYWQKEDEMANIFTKALSRPRFELLCTILEVIEFPSRRSIKV